jgi:hypothetical protein
MNKVIVDQNNNAQGVVPYLPLQGLGTPAPQQPAQGAAR